MPAKGQPPEKSRIVSELQGLDLLGLFFPDLCAIISIET
jgi:hypothetical protein